MNLKSANFEIPWPLPETHAACLAAAERLNWKVKKVKADRLRLGIPIGVGGTLGKVELALRERGGKTAVRARASNMGDELLGRMKLGKCLSRLEEAIRLEAGAPFPPRA